MITFTNPYLYVKGTCNVIVTDIATKKIDYQSSKVATNQFTTTCDLGEIRGGFGNPIAIQIPENCAVNLNLTAQDFSMAARGFQVGSTPYYNAVAPICETIVAASTTLTVTKTAVAPQGFDEAFCYVTESGASNPIGTAGEAYLIDPDTLAVQGFTAEVNKTYHVHYWWHNASAEGLTYYSMFAPAVKHVTAQLGVFSTYGASSSTQGSLVGWLYYIIPRMQFSGRGDVSGDQTGNGVTELSGTALPYEGGAIAEGCQDCAVSEMAYMIYVPAASATTAVQSLVIAGGEISVTVGRSVQTPVKYVMPNGTLVQPNFADLEYTITDTTYATVNSTGVISGVAAGDTEITVTLAEPALSVVANLSVVSA